MKEYRLKKWYPSLYSDITEGTEVEYKDGWIYYVNTRGNKTCVEFDPNEFIFTDYWELIEDEKLKPLFITEDGVEVLSDIDNLYAVNLTYFNKTKNTLRHSSWLIENSAYKVFYHEANADEYIWRNMRLFSYEDVVEWYGYGFKLGREGIYETLERLAKERSEQ